ncbi:Putative uncharacterized protein [Pseudomonas aeruginosa]|nr:Putative uncharacterized protein [Pseudomonas aeruginosa]
MTRLIDRFLCSMGQPDIGEVEGRGRRRFAALVEQQAVDASGRRLQRFAAQAVQPERVAVHFGPDPPRVRREQQDAVAHHQRLLDGVGDEQQGETHLFPQAQQFFLHLSPGQRVQRGERLVHQQDLRLHRQRPGDRHPRLHAPGQRVRVGLGEARQADLLEAFVGASLGLVARHLAGHPQGEQHVLPYGLPWRQLVELLEHHDTVGAGRPDRLSLKADLALAGRDEAGHRLEQGRLAATGRAEQDEAIGRVDFEADPLGGPHHARAGAVFEADSVHRQQGVGGERGRLAGGGVHRRLNSPATARRPGRNSPARRPACCGSHRPGRETPPADRCSSA